MDSFTGGCLCGNVRIVASGLPYRVGLCHCLDCRKHHGAPRLRGALRPPTDRRRPRWSALNAGSSGRFSPTRSPKSSTNRADEQVPDDGCAHLDYAGHPPLGPKRKVRDMPVLGMGGLFFRAKDPDALSAWYREHLGVGAGCVADPGEEPNEWVWMTR